MKRILITLAMICLCGGLASAQLNKPFSIYAGAGLTMPQGDYSDYYKMGYHGMGAAGFNLYPMFQGLAKVEYHSLPVDAATISNDATIVMYGVDARFAPFVPAAPIKVFGVAGIGMANIKTDASFDAGDFGSVDLGTTSSTEFYYEIGAGVEFRTSPTMSAFFMARYVTVANDFADFKYVPVTVGVKF